MTVAPDDLGVYLGAEVDAGRASTVIALAVELCRAELDLADGTDLPVACDAVILSSAGRAYVNPTSAPTEMLGPYQFSGATGGVFLNKAERAALRRLAGRTGAFSIDLVAGYPSSRFPDITS